MYKGIVTENIPKIHGTRKGRLTLNLVDDQNICTALSLKDFLEHPAPYKPAPHSEGEFLKGLYAQLDMRERLDMNVAFKRNSITNFLDKLEYLKTLVRYTKNQGVIA